MVQTKIISGNTEEEIWQQVTADLTADKELLEYQTILRQAARKILLDIDIDPGGGFESGYEYTKLSAEIEKIKDFRFAIHHAGFIDKMGKFLGMEDVQIGYPDFDEKLIIKTNDAEKVKTIFANSNVRKVFQLLTDFTLHITHHHVDDRSESFLELEIERGITDPVELRKIYNGFFSVLISLDILPDKSSL